MASRAARNAFAGLGGGDEQLRVRGDVARELSGGFVSNLGEPVSLVDLGQHRLVRHRRAVEHLHQRAVGILDSVSRVDQQHEAAQAWPAAQVIAHQPRPRRHLALGGAGIAVAWKIHQHQRVVEAEKVDLARAARRVGGAGEGGASGQRVDQARFADVGAPGEGHLGQGRFGKTVERRRTQNEAALLREQAARRLGRFVHARSSSSPPSAPRDGSARTGLAHDVPLLRDRQHVVPRPVDHEADWNARQHEGEDQRQQHEHLLLRRIGGRRVEPLLDEHRGTHDQRPYADHKELGHGCTALIGIRPNRWSRLKGSGADRSWTQP